MDCAFSLKQNGFSPDRKCTGSTARYAMKQCSIIRMSCVPEINNFFKSLNYAAWSRPDEDLSSPDWSKPYYLTQD